MGFVFLLSFVKDFVFLCGSCVRVEIVREHQRAINKSIREMDREKMRLEQEEQKIIREIKKMAKEGQMVRSARVCVRTVFFFFVLFRFACFVALARFVFRGSNCFRCTCAVTVDSFVNAVLCVVSFSPPFFVLSFGVCVVAANEAHSVVCFSFVFRFLFLLLSCRCRWQ